MTSIVHSIIALSALAFAVPSFAQDTAFAAAGDIDGPFHIVLTNAPCPADMLAMIPAEYRTRFQLAHERFQGRDIRACWALDAPIVVIFDEEGDQGGMPMDAFKPVSRS